MNTDQRLRARGILILTLLIAGGLCVSLYWTQIVKGDTYSAQAEKQYARPSSAMFDRGSIFFLPKDGIRSSAATVASGFVLYMNPTQLTNPNDAYEALSHYADLDKDEFMKKAARTTDPYEELARRVDEKTSQSIASLSLKGIGLVKESWRSYPADGLSAQVLGIVGEDDKGKLLGRYGLERSYESVLGRTGIGANSGVLSGIYTGLGLGGGSPEEGDIITTIEPTVGAYLEKILSQTASTWRSDEIGGIVMDPSTGEIVAMSAFPSFNPNELAKVKGASVFSNPLVEHVYEMGSIMKPLTMAAGLDSGAVTPTSTYNDTGTLILDTKKISNYDGRARGPGTTMQQVLSQSLNIGIANITMKMGNQTFGTYFNAFGLGEKTGIDQPNEATGIVGDLKKGRDIEIATAGYGQGIAVSPIAMTRALSVLANGGRLPQPHLVKEIDYADGRNEKITREAGPAVLQKQSVDETTRMLVEVVDTALLQGKLKMDDYSIAAKTGTAQIPDRTNRGYYTDRYLHSFFGYFPAYDPKFIVFLYQVYPKGAQYASETLAEPFGELAQFLISYYNIPPDR